MNEDMSVIIDPNRLFVSRPPTGQGSPSSARSNFSSRYTERIQFGLAWLNLTYAPQSFISKRSKTILRNVSGQIKFGQILGIMGPSGCGKSTLLRCINGRIATGLSPETKIFVSTSRPIHSCFIVQDQKEHLLMNLTTKEVLLYASKIKNNSIETNVDNIKNISFDLMPKKSNKGIMSSTMNLIGIKTITKFDHMSNIRRIMTDLTLNDCADTLVSNCSGGQQKRIVIALELTAEHKPNIMCIDEPTSGLDSNAAEQVIECLRDICRNHSIGVITTIHQPNSDILYMFDNLYVLAKGGYCVFNGCPQNLRDYLLEAKIVIKDTQIPIEVLMKTASKTKFPNSSSEEFQVDQQIILLAEKTKKSEDTLKQKCYTFGKLTEPKKITIKSIGFNFLDFWVLIQRAVKCNIIRGWKPILILTLFELGTGLFNAYIFGKPGIDDGCINFDPTLPMNTTCLPNDGLNLSKDEPDTVKNVKLLYFLLLTHNFLQLCFSILTYPMEVKLFFNEQQNRWYSTGAYFWSRNLVDTVVGLFITFIFVTPIYFVTGQTGTIFERNFGWFILSHFLCLLCIQGMSSTISIIAVRNFRICLILGIGGMLVNTLFSGFLIPINIMDQWIQKLSYLSFMRLTFETQMYALYGFNRCNPEESRWSLILFKFDFDEKGFHLNFTIMVVFAVIWRLLALICLIIKTNEWNLITAIKGYHKNVVTREVMFIRDSTEII